MDYHERYQEWLENENIDKKTKEELESIRDDKKEIQERFYTYLNFGTAGLRGKIGAGTNRMNTYIISMATKALAEVIKSKGENAKKKGVAIAYDTRHKSDEFAKTAALVLANNGIKTYLFEGVRPTPELSFAVRRLKTQAGIVVTASHNPKEYNGYKVYWDEGSQILSDIAEEITEEIGNIDDIATIQRMDESEALSKGLLKMIGKEIDDEYIEKVKGLSLRDDIDKDINVVYTPLNGTGRDSVKRVLRERGFKNIYLVEEQENPDPDFKTVDYPNPEDIKTFEYAIKLGKEQNSDILIANDPDCDRMACMVKNREGKYISLNGNQTGALLIKYILEALKDKDKLPNNGAIVKSIVTGDLGKEIAKKYNIKTVDTLTGFKNICGKANEFEKTGEYKFIFGYEESIGYVYDTIVRDKDGVIATMLMVEAAAYYKKKDKNLLEKLDEIYREHGYYHEDLFSVVLEGIEGKKRISRMMKEYKKNYITEINNSKLIKITDFENQLQRDLLNNKKEDIEIKKTNALKFEFDNKSWYAIRPSGTEPKIKIYIYGKGQSKKDAKEKVEDIKSAVMNKLNSVD